MKSNKNDLPSISFIIIGVIAGLVAVLDYIGVVGFPIGVFGVSAFYIGAAFYTAFAIWFRIKGLLAIYIGLLIGSLFSGTFTIFAFILALGNVFGAAIPALFFNKLGFNPELKRFRDYVAFVISATILQNIISATWVLTGFYLVGIMPAEAAFLASAGWIGGGIIVSLVIGIPLLKFTTPVIKKTTLIR
ncbi:hypothetical protein COU60_05200 [Candidatus Pacearchaeota archaeon CG10_big_fil_rev_8_21_14_0_10_34_76]|nr:MAG: hypothetical protein COU60_05200 [Candidatus Pacearchaeota archaeon CG10_big_fil_rev_8_21_14_0_10_34_76]